MHGLASQLSGRTVRPGLTLVNSLVPLMDEKSGRRLERYIRARWGRKQGGIRGLAKAIGGTAETIYSWFRGETEPYLGTLREVAAALGVRPYQILAAMDGDGPAAAIDPELERLVEERVRAEVERQLGRGPA